MRRELLGVARQFINFVELLVPPHKVQADLLRFSLYSFNRNDARVEPAARLAAARIYFCPFDDRGIR